jgi:hypothetical protein
MKNVTDLVKMAIFEAKKTPPAAKAVYLLEMFFILC